MRSRRSHLGADTMTEKDADHYSDLAIRIGQGIVIFFRLIFVPSIFILPYAIWKFSPSKVVALCIIFFGTTFPFLLWGTIFNALSLVAIKLEDTFQLKGPCAFMKMATSWFVVLLARVIHGHEVHGEENIPESSGGLIVYYHPMIVYDAVFLNCKRYIERGKFLGGIAHRMVTSNLSALCKFSEYYAERDRLVKDLKDGRVRSVAPGGEIEGAFSENYELEFDGRIGFAEVAKECGVPVLPMFTVNCQQAMPVSNYGFTRFFRELFRRKRMTVFFPLICLPVKMRTFIGEPIHCGKDESPADFAERVKAAIMDLRDRNQRRPGSILLALLERFGYPSYTDQLQQRKLK